MLREFPIRVCDITRPTSSLSIGEFMTVITHALQLFFNRGDLTRLTRLLNPPSKEDVEREVRKRYTTVPADYDTFLEVASRYTA